MSVMAKRTTTPAVHCTIQYVPLSNSQVNGRKFTVSHLVNLTTHISASSAVYLQPPCPHAKEHEDCATRNMDLSSGHGLICCIPGLEWWYRVGRSLKPCCWPAFPSAVLLLILLVLLCGSLDIVSDSSIEAAKHQKVSTSSKGMIPS